MRRRGGVRGGAWMRRRGGVRGGAWMRRRGGVRGGEGCGGPPRRTLGILQYWVGRRARFWSCPTTFSSGCPTRCAVCPTTGFRSNSPMFLGSADLEGVSRRSGGCFAPILTTFRADLVGLERHGGKGVMNATCVGCRSGMRFAPIWRLFAADLECVCRRSLSIYY